MWAWILMAIGVVLLISQRRVLFPKNIEKVVAIGLIVVGVVMLGVFDGVISGVSQSTAGTIDVELHDGVVNGSVTSEDYLNDANDEMVFYSADANIVDGAEYCANVTIRRSVIGEASAVRLSCTAPDKALSGTTEDGLVTKSSGKVNLDFTSTTVGTDKGTHETDTKVFVDVAFAEADTYEEAEICFDQVEAYHDAMSDMDDYYTVSCTADGTPFSIKVLANS